MHSPRTARNRLTNRQPPAVNAKTRPLPMTMQLPDLGSLGGWTREPQQPYAASQGNPSSSGITSSLSSGVTIKGSQGPRFGPVLVIPFIPNPDLHHHSLAFPIAPSTRPLNAGIPLSLLICTARQSRGCTHSESKGPIRCANRADKHQPVRPSGPNPTQPKDLQTRAKHFPWGLKLHARKATEQARSDAVEQNTIAVVPQRR